MMRRVRLNASKWKGAAGGVRILALIATGVFVLAGCGSSESDPAAGGVKRSGKPGASARTARPDMVAAVSSSKAPGSVELRFNIPARPVIGQPTEIELSLTPTVDLERLIARFQVPDGLELVSGAETARADRPIRGVEITHTLTVIPKADGIFNIIAVVLTDSATESVSRTFSIPLIAGAGLPEAPPDTSGPSSSRPN